MNSSFSMSASRDKLSEARMFAFNVMKQAGVVDKDAHRTELIVGELCANAIEYGDENSEIHVLLTVDDRSVIIECTNMSENLNVTAEELNSKLDREVDMSSKRGRGLFIIRQWTKEASFEDIDGGIKVHVVQTF